MQPVFTLTDLLRQVPRKVIGGVITGAGFAVIGAFNTFQFFVNRTADLIAYATNTRREEEWAPVMVATFAVMYLTYYILLRLFAEQQPERKQINNNTPKLQLFAANSKFEKNLRRAEKDSILFSLPFSSRTSTQPPTPIKKSLEEILDAALEETKETKGTNPPSKKLS